MILYTIDCPQCKVLETKLNQANINFDVCKDMTTMRSKGIKSAPYLELDDGTLLNFSAAVKWVKEQA